MTETAEILAGALREAGGKLVLVVTGAGISLASGIPTFRGTDPGAVWQRDVTELGTFDFFRREPVESWRWYLERFRATLGARPNPAHDALAALERWHAGRGGRFQLVTQNVDVLHETAGSEALIKVHGSADRVRCPRTGCQNGAPAGSLPRADFDFRPFLDDPQAEHLPRCPECGEILRQHVLWFDEYYQEHDDYRWSDVQASAQSAHLVLFVGTSFSVGVTDYIVQNALLNRVPVYSIDPAATRPPYPGITVLAAKAEHLLPAVCEQLGAEVETEES